MPVFFRQNGMMNIRTPQSELSERAKLQAKEQQQLKKDNLAKALRDNLRRRKASISSSVEAKGDDSET